MKAPTTLLNILWQGFFYSVGHLGTPDDFHKVLFPSSYCPLGNLLPITNITGYYR